MWNGGSCYSNSNSFVLGNGASLCADSPQLATMAAPFRRRIPRIP